MVAKITYKNEDFESLEKANPAVAAFADEHRNDEYTVNIENLKVSGSAENIHKLAHIYGLAACEYGNQIIDEIHGKHRDTLIT